MSEENGGIFAALLDAQRQAAAITKSGTNTHQGWTFVTVEEVTRVARQALNTAGLVAFLRVRGPFDERTLDACLVLVHPVSGQEAHFDVPWPVERSGPQARRAAYAYARKQALLELLSLSEGDPEATAQPTPESKPGRRVRVGKQDSAGVSTPKGDSGNETDAEGNNAPTVPAEQPKTTRATPAPGMATRQQAMAIHSALTMLERIKGKRLNDEERHAVIARAAGYEGTLASTYDLSHEQASRAIESLKAQAREHNVNE